MVNNSRQVPIVARSTWVVLIAGVSGYFLCVNALADGGKYGACVNPIACTACYPPICKRDTLVGSPTFNQCVFTVAAGAAGDENDSAMISECQGFGGDGCEEDQGPCGNPVVPECDPPGFGLPCTGSCVLALGPPVGGCT